MAFNYEVLTAQKDKISSDKDELTSLFESFNSLVAENVGNPTVWAGASATEFKGKWNTFAEEKFPVAKQNFEKEILNLSTSIEAYNTAEQ